MLTSYYEVLCLRKEKDREDEGKWNRARWAVFHIIWSIPGKKTGWARTVERMFPFPWDVKAPIQVDCKVSEEEETAFMQIFEDFKSKKNK